ncbi:MAG: hypothetical protein M1830_005087, partial [Pleopsidium flavum]
MASATDIVTYIGVPLAVLGVLPILWTAIKTLKLSWDIRAQLSKNFSKDDNHSYISTNTDVLSGRVDVNYHNVRLEPLIRTDERYMAYKPKGKRSELKGGTWTILFWSPTWSMEPTKKYTLTPTDRLRQPAARVNFTRLVDFLRDRGAVLSAEGFRNLKTERLRVSADTVLMEALDDSAVLSVAKRDINDDEELLTLRLDQSAIETLKPNPKVSSTFIQLRHGLDPINTVVTRGAPVSQDKAHVATRPKSAKVAPFATQSDGDKSNAAEPNSGSETADLMSVLATEAGAHKGGSISAAQDVEEPRRLRAPNGRWVFASELGGWAGAHSKMEAFEQDLQPLESGWEDILGDKGSDTDSDTWSDPIQHASGKEKRMIRLQKMKEKWPSPSFYYDARGLVNPTLFHVRLEADHKRPTNIAIAKEGLQNAVLVEYKENCETAINISHLRQTDQGKDRAGDWFCSVAKAVAAQDGGLCRFSMPGDIFTFARVAYENHRTVPCGVLLELLLIDQSECPDWKPESWLDLVFKERIRRGSRPFISFDEEMAIKMKSEDDAVPRAIQSPAWHINKVAHLMVIWLRREFHLNAGTNAAQIAEWTLHRMLMFPAEAADIGKMLSRWQTWSDRNVMGTADFKYVRIHRITFALAACLLSVLGEYANADDAQAPDILDDCLARWKD